ncbi:MAG TPA: carboxypeptidase-like regulatory domain-containing protein [Gemmatimonadaceae bacterium]
MQHPDEGTIHAWLDGELPEDQANEIAAHANECLECSAMVAEARGLIAASTRILTALDNVPAGVIPEGAARPPAPVRRRRWYDRTDIRAAAALLIVASASYLVVKRDSGASRETLMVADKVQPAPAPLAAPASPADKPAMEQSVAPQRAGNVAAGGSAAVTGINKAMSRETISGREAQTPPASRADETVAVPDVAEPRLAPPSVQSSISGVVKMTSKRGRLGDSAFLSEKRSIADAARATKPAFGVVEGRVIDQRNEQGLATAQVVLPGSPLGALTDKDGRFSITNVPAGEQHLTVRRIGYEAKDIALVVPDDGSVTANVVLAPQLTTLSQVVVTGAAAARTASSLSLRVKSVDSTSATRRTVYEISPGVRVTLAETPVDSSRATEARWVAGGAVATALGATQSDAKVAQPTTVAAAPAAAINTISWTDRGRRFVLSGPVLVETLQELKKQLMQLRR